MSEFLPAYSNKEECLLKEINESNPENYLPDEKQLARMQSLIDITNTCEETGTNITIFGGYGLDGLYGRLTRGHDDIDMFVSDDQVEKMDDILIAMGYSKDPLEIDKHVFRNKIKDPIFKVEFVGLSTLRQFSDKSIDYFVPDKPNASLDDQPFKAITLLGQKEIIEIQNKRAMTNNLADYPIEKRDNQTWIINNLEEKDVR